ncbi:Zinc finger, PHD-finger [Dillenia turbinata]|uniref:Zinc finger, PHD-finger n=1 Tax=Dillenia turbinata TaxID=194707 RepID=A0AAN8ZH85_9MAGN
MVVNDRPLKRIKRRPLADLQDFHSFPAAGDDVVPFREGVQRFLSKHAGAPLPSSLFSKLLIWQIMLNISSSGDDLSPQIAALDVVEEDVTRSRSIYCDQCRVVGWGEHPVCRKRYHFIIRAKSGPVEAYQKACTACGALMHLLDTRCKLCSCDVTTNDLEDWVYLQFDDGTPLLHGVVHSNGYGHLLTINGKEGGSKHLSGCDLMNFWDRLCRALVVRKVSVMDVSKKYGMEYRLLHSVAKGHTWYGNWGFKFGAGCYGLTLDDYNRALDTISSLPLSIFLFQGWRSQTRLKSVIAFYQSLSDNELVTVGDLFSFLFKLIFKTRNSVMPYQILSESTDFGSVNDKTLSIWTRNDIERIEQAMIKVLAAAKVAGWVTRRALKGALSKAASPELLDYCLKSLPRTMAADDMVVEARYNQVSKVIEFRLQPRNVGNVLTGPCMMQLPKEQIVGDLKFLYDTMLNPNAKENLKPLATRELLVDSATILLDCKQFVKDYVSDLPRNINPSKIYVTCCVEVGDQKDGPMPPPELIILPSFATTVGDLKSEISKAFEEVYVIFKKFQVKRFPEHGKLEDSVALELLMGPGATVTVQARGKVPIKIVNSRFCMEKGTESWTVECMCGADDDDGERMLACDTCSIWQHTRCVGIDSFDEIPAKFVCFSCLNLHCKESDSSTTPDEKAPKTSSSNSITKDEAVDIRKKIPPLVATCKDEAAGDVGLALESGLAMTFGVG